MDTRSMRPYALAVSLLVAAVATPLPAATYPSWWTTRGVVDTNAAPSDYSPANLGQLKWFATNACDELEEKLSAVGGAGPAIWGMVTNFSRAGNFVAINLGQLKTVAMPFYARLWDVGCTNPLPWTTNSTADDADFAVANLGQLKHVFSFEVEPPANLGDTDGDGMPDAWETAHGLNPNDEADAALDPDGDGWSNLHEYLRGTDPHKARVSDVTEVLGLALMTPLDDRRPR